MNKISETETYKYLMQSRSQAKSSGIKVPEIHGANKGINPHIKPGRQRPLPTLPMHSIPPTNLAQPVDKGSPTNPIPKPWIGQGRAILKRKIMTNQPIPLPKLTLAQPIPTPNPKGGGTVIAWAYSPITRECATSASYAHTITPTSAGRSYIYHATNRSQNTA